MEFIRFSSNKQMLYNSPMHNESLISYVSSLRAYNTINTNPPHESVPISFNIE